MSQEELATKLGITQAYMSMLESDKKTPDLDLLDALSDALGCTVVDLLSRSPDEPESIWAAWERVATQDRPQALAVLKALGKKAS